MDQNQKTPEGANHEGLLYTLNNICGCLGIGLADWDLNILLREAIQFHPHFDEVETLCKLYDWIVKDAQARGHVVDPRFALFVGMANK